MELKAPKHIRPTSIDFTIINNSGLDLPAFLYMNGTTNPDAPENNTYYLSS